MRFVRSITILIIIPIIIFNRKCNIRIKTKVNSTLYKNFILPMTIERVFYNEKYYNFYKKLYLHLIPILLDNIRDLHKITAVQIL